MTNSRGEAWARVRQVEDVMAVVARIDERRRVMRVHAWREGSWDVVFQEATDMQADIMRLKELLRGAWDVLYGATHG